MMRSDRHGRIGDHHGKSGRCGLHSGLFGQQAGQSCECLLPQLNRGLARQLASRIDTCTFFARLRVSRDLDGKKYDSVPRRLELPVLDPARRLAAIADIDRLFASSKPANEPSLFAAQG